MKENIPDLIFLDLKIPGINGMDCLLEIRKNKFLGTIPIVVYTNSLDIKEIGKSYANGANMFIKKIPDYAGLKSALAKVLNLDWTLFPMKGERKNFVYRS